MTYSSPSRAIVTQPFSVPTLHTVIALVAADQSLPPQRRQDLCSAARTVAKVLGRQPEDVLAIPRALRDRLKDFTPAMAGLGASRWRNVLSLLRAALRQAGLIDMPGRHSNALLPAWADLQRCLNDRHSRIGLSRLMSFASAQGIEPEAVDDDFLASFREALLNDSLVGNPAAIHRRTCQLWNRAAANILAWPKTVLTIPVNRATYTFPWTHFPPSLHNEVLRFLDHLGGDDILAERDFRPLAPVTLASREFSLRQFASALVQRGRDPQTLRSLEDLVIPETVKHGLRFFLERPHVSKRQVHGIACVLKAVARHWVKVEVVQVDQLRKICKAVDPGPVGMTEKNKSRLRPLDDNDTVRKLLTLPQRQVAAIVRKKSPPSHRDALVIQTALLIELLINVPIRVGNLARLSLERHLIISRPGLPRTIQLAIPGEEVKNGVAIEAALPPSAVALLDLYLRKYRRLLTQDISPWLFPGRGIGHKSIQSLRGQIQNCLANECGLRFNPHLFRHAMGKIFLDRNPGAYGVVQLMLGHRSIETTASFYCGAEEAAVRRAFDACITGVRTPSEGLDNPPSRGRNAKSPGTLRRIG